MHPTWALWCSVLEPAALLHKPGTLGGPTDRDGREDDHQRDYDGVDELPDQCASCLAEDRGKQVLDGCVPGQGGYESQGHCDQLRELVEDLSGQLLPSFSLAALLLRLPQLS